MEIFKTINPTLYIVLLSVALLSSLGFILFSKGQNTSLFYDIMHLWKKYHNYNL